MDVEELTRENEALNEQVKLLVKTERRLYGAQRTIEMQLARLEALTKLAVNASRADDPDLILELALHTLLGVLDADQGVALMATAASPPRLAAMATQPGCEPAERHFAAEALALPRLTAPILWSPRPPRASAPVAALLDAVNDYKVAERTTELARANDELALSLRRVHEAQTQLIETSKSAAILTLVAGLSHELNNPIAVILGYAQGLLSSAPEPLARTQLSAIERQARRCSQLVKALLSFAENRPVALDSIPPAVLLQRAVDAVERDAAARGVRVFVDALADDLPSLLVSAASVHEALGQLVKNALDATPAGGTIALHARERTRNAVSGIELSVRDTGVGIPHAFLPRIFDPFFTTKPPGKGVGLGLSLARRAFEAHGGQIDVRSELGHGTAVRVWLPVAEAEHRAPDASLEAAEGGR